MSTPEGDSASHKQHRERNAGRKADKKKIKKKDPSHIIEDPKQKNPKAFTFNSAIKAERNFRRKQDIDTKKQHIPVVDRTPLEPPPILVAVVGPPKVGKSLVIQCLIKSYTKNPLTSITGPVTLVSGKRRRITFIECNNDINSMIDIAKVADLVLLLIDASFGFEMEIFEFLNICQVHGMPKIMGVLTHLDQIKNAKQMRKTKKLLKHRFWTEVYSGAKLFYLSGLLHDEYLRMEVKNLARFISVMKFRPLTWRTTHPYLLVDRVEDLTDPELIRQNSKVDRTVSVYGYVRGVPLNKQSSIHIPGCGDLKIKDISFLPDPCPLPEQLKKRALVERERLIYAPFSGVGGIVYDKDAVYVELGGSHSHTKDDTGLLSQLLQTHDTLDHKLEQSELQLFTNSAPIKSQDVNQIFTEEKVFDQGRIRRKVVFNDSEKDKNEDEEDDESDEEMDLEGELNKLTAQKTKASKDETEEEEGEDDDDDDGDEEDDEDEEMEDGSDDEDGQSKDEIGKSRKRKAVEKSAKKKMKLDPDSKNPELYRELRINQDKHVKDKISEALGLIGDKNLKASNSMEKSTEDKTRGDDGNDESFDELSEDEDMDFELKLDNDDDDYNDDIKSNKDDKDDGENEEDGDEDDENENEEDEDDQENLKWKENIAEKAREAFLSRQQTNINVMRLVYGVFDGDRNYQEDKQEEPEKEEVGGIFHVVQAKQKQKIEERELKNQEESVFFSKELPRDWLAEDNKCLLVNRFVTGKWKESEDAEELLKLDDLKDDDEEVYGDFEDLETGEKHKASEKQPTTSEPTPKVPKEMTSDELDERKRLLEKKRKLKEQFDADYDTTDKTYYEDLKLEVERQAELNKSEFEGLDDNVRVTLEGYRPGMYVRLEIDNVPCELIVNLDPTYPMIVGGLLPGEENIGYVQTRVKKHRWYSRILKSKDPLILSVGWRRFQTMAIFSKLEDNLRNRMLKYTPEHVACMAHFWGPITPQNTGVLAVQDVSKREPGFRIAATGTIVELDKSTKVVKKLKLTGVPYKIYKKTAFIKDMFTSALEVAKFEGAKIKTVSGIRGQIKKAVSRPEGCFRATFEDKIQLSDIVFCRTWYRVDIPKFYNPVTSLLLPPEQKSQWKGMKTTGQLKRELNLKATPNTDNLYTPVLREPKVFKPLVVPRTLQKDLPYRDKPKLQPVLGKRKTKFEEKRVAVVREPREENVARMMKMIRTNYSYKQEKLKEATHKRITEYQKRVDEETAKKMKRQREMKKQVFRDLSKLEAKANKKKGF
ncbi:ribosome biogenesis protein BMS1 homolog [Nasonia vitripennis]|uniref:Bms1-type G domain-containing protein n=1 Tax=Nasonia vitripennis TaxID=7425 RepID=A0A7M7QV00_NASVI|nr:ribosome biogenesis protein BMS1 homolog [Nasonia vitripennis]XP_032453195.1 ribosome biogenesis protein BMS1 homolog [Nasonia vitripennis]